ncbi:MULTISPECIES: DNA-3-methyladenine glycosylase [Arthrobacter]|uniref:Putative 3-methyladenine DNA glycosylase n=2 Tax=Arthrobacter TaxID=1663 RepID=A0ABU9KM24_9MICC|nr:DNA-3-methyladenine glycosylase [Arthrobacter sp. YJM1]MDP5227900.1 DNA-3-methyladenine glycosylase [Arthrobacter sp. YJM1]
MAGPHSENSPRSENRTARWLAPGEIRELLSGDPVELAPRLLGAVISHTTPEGTVAVRLTELEAYRGPRDSGFPDPGAHSYRGKTARNAPMFGPPAHLYCYFTYGMHYCVNMVCWPDGRAGGILMRAGVVQDGLELARSRRPSSRKDIQLAQGPARLASCLGLTTAESGRDLLAAPLALAVPRTALMHDAGLGAGVRSGPRVGVSGEGGGPAYPWRFWVDGEPSVSPYRAAKARTR